MSRINGYFMNPRDLLDLDFVLLCLDLWRLYIRYMLLYLILDPSTPDNNFHFDEFYLV